MTDRFNKMQLSQSEQINNAMSGIHLYKPLIEKEKSKLLVPYLASNIEYSAAFKYLPAMKYGLDVVGIFLVSRAIRRAYFVYEYGLIYAVIWGTAMSSSANNIREINVTNPLLNGEFDCRICLQTRGLAYDIVLNFFTAYGGLLVVTMLQADRFKSAEIPSYYRLKFTKSQTSLWKGLWKTGWKKGGGLRSAFGLLTIPGILLTEYQLAKSKQLWNEIPEENKRDMFNRQRSATLSALSLR